MKSMEDKKEKTYLRSAQRGDKKAIAGLYDLHYQAVYNYIYYRVNDLQDAEDLSAEVFIRMIHKLPGYTDRGRPFLAWLYTIAKNIVIDHHRAGEKKIEVPINEEILEDRIQTPDQAVQDRQTSDCFRIALQLLPEAQQQLLIYRFINGFSTPQIIQLLDKSDRAVRSLQHRSLKSLEKVLVEENCL
jgi:RNA polymerase sigma-70 factor (ECF subfamily)